MSNVAEATREQLMATNELYQNLSREHTQYAAELEKLTSKTYLNEEEKLKEIELKKLKLWAKDQMEMLVHKQSQTH